jgi:uncharacterized protein YqgC (DUF456 family)
MFIPGIWPIGFDAGLAEGIGMLRAGDGEGDAVGVGVGFCCGIFMPGISCAFAPCIDVITMKIKHSKANLALKAQSAQFIIFFLRSLTKRTIPVKIGRGLNQHRARGKKD